MPHDPAAVLVRALQPAASDREEDLGMVLADVVQVIGDRAPHVELGVVLEELEERQDRRGIALELA
jgi:hypothetical protein